MWCYEGGQHFNMYINNTVLAAAGLPSINEETLRLDIIDFYKNHLEESYREYYKIIIEGCGGHISHFDTFYPTAYFWATPQTRYQMWGTSEGSLDRALTSSRYKALRDLSLEFGNGELKDFSPVINKRRQSIIT